MLRAYLSDRTSRRVLPPMAPKTQTVWLHIMYHVEGPQNGTILPIVPQIRHLFSARTEADTKVEQRQEGQEAAAPEDKRRHLPHSLSPRPDMRAADASMRRSFADFQTTSRLHTRSPGGRSAAADEAESGGKSGGGDRRRSASATPQRPAGRVKVLWEDPSAPSRSRSAGRSSTGRKAAKKQSDKRSPSDRKQKQAALPQAVRTLVQRVVEWDTRLKAVA